jgi:hypothetical protein
VNRLGLGLLGVAACGCATHDSQRLLRTAVDARQASLDECYATALDHDRTTAGTMKLWVHVRENAHHVDAVEIEKNAKLANKRLNRCVRAALLNIDIGEPADSEVKVQYTLAFQPDE